MRTFNDSADQSWVHQGRIYSAIRRCRQWLDDRCFMQTICAWCLPKSNVLRKAWLVPRRTSHGMCRECSERMMRDTKIFNV